MGSSMPSGEAQGQGQEMEEETSLRLSPFQLLMSKVMFCRNMHLRYQVVTIFTQPGRQAILSSHLITRWMYSGQI